MEREWHGERVTWRESDMEREWHGEKVTRRDNATVRERNILPERSGEWTDRSVWEKEREQEKEWRVIEKENVIGHALARERERDWHGEIMQQRERKIECHSDRERNILRLKTTVWVSHRETYYVIYKFTLIDMNRHTSNLIHNHVKVENNRMHFAGLIWGAPMLSVVYSLHVLVCTHKKEMECCRRLINMCLQYYT